MVPSELFSDATRRMPSARLAGDRLPFLGAQRLSSTHQSSPQKIPRKGGTLAESKSARIIACRYDRLSPRCLTCPSVPAFPHMIHQRLTRPTSAHFRARHSPVSGQLYGTAAGGAALSSRFPVAFRLPAFASWAFLSRQGIPPFSRSAYSTPHTASGPRRGFYVPHV
jgi:hypothetical protein